MARLALHADVRAGQRKFRRVMVERRRLPGRRRMARFARPAEILGKMVWIRRRVKIRIVTLIASRVRKIVVTVRVACLALHADVLAGQRKIRRAMVERRWLPGRRRMALCTVRRKTTLDVVWVCRPGKIRTVATHALRRRTLERSIDVAVRARRGKVRSGEGKRRGIVIETMIPRIRGNAVARDAIGGKSGGRVIWIRRGGVICGMAADAFDGAPPVLIIGGVVVAAFAGQDAVFSQQGKPRLLVPFRHIGDFPRLHGMAVQAIPAKFALMDVVVARRTTGPRVGKFQIGMARHARHRCMLPDKFKAGGRVIEREIVPHLPGIGHVAGLTGEVHRPVGRLLTRCALRPKEE